MSDNTIPKVHPTAPPPYTPYPEPPQAGFVPPGPTGYNPYNTAPAQGFVPVQNAAGFPNTNYGATNVVIPPPTEVIIVNNGLPTCPVCRNGVLQTDFSCLGIFCAIFFFPLGILCCLAMREQRCSYCRTLF